MGCGVFQLYMPDTSSRGLQVPRIGNKEMEKIIILGAIGKNPRKNRDGFRVLSGGGYKYRITGTYTYRAAFNNKEMEKEIIILGRIGNTKYQNNDRCKVLYGGV